MTDFTVDESSTNPNNNTTLSPEPLDINMDNQSMLAPVTQKDLTALRIPRSKLTSEHLVSM